VVFAYQPASQPANTSGLASGERETVNEKEIGGSRSRSPPPECSAAAARNHVMVVGRVPQFVRPFVDPRLADERFLKESKGKLSGS
jgi:hypothetical protein